MHNAADLSSSASNGPMVMLRCLATTSFDAASLEREFDLLDSTERSSAQRLLIAEDRRDYVAAHALLRRTLSGMAPGIAPSMWHFDRTDQGKPFVSDAHKVADRLAFSLSHTRGLVACAVIRAGNLGVDVERNAAFEVDTLLDTVCSSAERTRIVARSGQERMKAFLDLWTLKEAYWKARGLGIVEDLRTVSFDVRKAERLGVILPPRDHATWSFVVLRPTTDSRVSLAVECGEQAAVELDAAFIGEDGRLRALRPAQSGSTGSGRGAVLVLEPGTVAAVATR